MKTTTTVVWQALAWPATEYVQLARGHELVAEGVVTGSSHEQTPFALWYIMRFSPGWEVQAVTVESLVGAGRLELRREGQEWYDGTGKHLPAYDGVEFIDNSLSPLTNTLPIKRLRFDGQKSVRVEALYLDLPSFEIRLVHQFYTRLDAHTYRYQDGELPDFVRDLRVDDDGLVVEYPGLFRRVNGA